MMFDFIGMYLSGFATGFIIGRYALGKYMQRQQATIKALSDLLHEAAKKEAELRNEIEQLRDSLIPKAN